MSNSNYTEIEAKFHVEDLARMEKKLIAAGAQLVQARVHEYNLRFDKPDGELRKANQVLRLRQDEGARITFKGASSVEDGVFNREEIEFTVGDFEAAKLFLEGLGYEVFMIYEKYRTTYTLVGQLWMLDELPFGNFVEIEGNQTEAIQVAAEGLGLKWEARLGLGYAGLFARVKANLGLSFRDLTFDNFAGVEVGIDSLGVLPADGAIGPETEILTSKR